MPTTQTPALISMSQAILPTVGARKIILLDNWLPTMRGTKRKRGAQERFNSSAFSGTPQVTGIFEFRRSDGRRFTISTMSGAIQSSPEASGTYNDISKSGLGWTDGALTSFAVLNDLVVMCNRAGDTPQYTDGTGATRDVTGMRNHKYAVSHKGRIFAAGAEGEHGGIDYSGRNDILDWSTDGGTLTEFVRDHGRITGLSPSHFNLIYVFYEGGAIHKLLTPGIATPSGWSLEPVIQGVTLLSHQSIMKVGNDIAFVSDKPALRRISTTEKFGDLEVAEDSLSVEDSFTKYLNNNESRLENIVGAYYDEDNLICLGVSGSGSNTNDRIYSMSTVIQDEAGNFEWQEWTGISPSAIAAVRVTNRRRLMTGDYAGFVNLQDSRSFSDNGSTAITATLTIPSIALIDPVWRKGHRQLKYGYISHLSSDSATLTYRTFERNVVSPTRTATMRMSGRGFVLDTDALGTGLLGDYWILEGSVELKGSGKRLELEIVHSTNNSGPELVWIAPMLKGESY